ncbi:hypothetical protein U1Q18_021850 [Sarracenia purpurea var. burkii]
MRPIVKDSLSFLRFRVRMSKDILDVSKTIDPFRPPSSLADFALWSRRRFCISYLLAGSIPIGVFPMAVPALL